MTPAATPRRIVVYAMWDPAGEIRPYVERALRRFQPHAARILVVANGGLSPAGRDLLVGMGVGVLERANEGFDIEAHRAGLEHLGDGADGADEVLLTNDTWFGPVSDFDEVFARMSQSDADVWGMTEHAEVTPHPLTGSGTAARHLQTYWLVIRGRVLRSEAWRGWWRDLAPVRSYDDAVLAHETVLTGHLESAGFRTAAAYPAADFASENASLWEAERLVAAGCPTVKRRAFFQWPPALAAHGASGRWVLDAMVDRGYPEELVTDGLVRTVQPRVLHTNAALMTVLPDRRLTTVTTPRVLAVVHVYYTDMLAELMAALRVLPAGAEVLVTTSDEDRAAELRRQLSLDPPPWAVEVRVAGSNDGRDLSAFYIAAKDRLASGDHDLVVKLHSKRTPQDGFAVGRHFRRQQLSNLVGSADFFRGILALFDREPHLGIVFPPAVHIGYPTMGHGWWANREGTQSLADRMGITVPLDEASPLAPYGSMFVARPEALRLIWEHPWTYDHFAGADAYRDGGPAHVLERIPVYAAAQAGYHARTVVTAEYFAVGYTALSQDYERLGVVLPGRGDEAVDLMLRAGPLGGLALTDVARMHLRLRHPGLGARLRRALWPLVRLRRQLRARRSPS